MKKLFLFALAAAAVSACKKDSENTPSRMDLITAKNWRVTALTSTTTITPASGSSSTTTRDDYAQYSACEKDNFYKFNTNKTVVADEGPTKCDPSDPQTTTIAWDFNSDQTKLLTGANYSEDILELSATTLRLRETGSYTYTINTTTYSVVSTTTFTAI